MAQSKRWNKNTKTQENHRIKRVVVDNDVTPVLGLNTAQQLGLLKLEENNFEKVSTIFNSNAFNEGKGAFPGEQHLTVDSTIGTTYSNAYS